MSRRRPQRFRAALIAVPFLVAAAFVGANLAVRSGGDATRAFAEAGPGTYAIALRSDGASDTVIAVDARSGTVLEVADIPHLEGFTSYAAVSPDGATLAAVVADAGTLTRPVASLHLIDLKSGAASRVAEGIDQLQQPLWAPDGRSVIVTRTVSGDAAASAVTVLRVAVPGGAAAEAMVIPGVGGAYPAGFDADGRLLVAAIDSTGTTLYREQLDTIHLSDHITRDWEVSPDGTRVAFIEAQLTDGLRFVAREVDLAGGMAQAQSAASPDGQQLGIAWHPAGGAVTAGQEPGSGGVRAASSGTPGFDIPLQYSPDGAYLAVEAWSGSSFADPGSASLQVLGADGRADLAGANRFAGWTQR